MRAPVPALTAALLGLALALTPHHALAVRQATVLHPDCQQLLELYRTCHKLGLQAPSAATCMEGAQDYAARAGAKGSPGARALSEVVCSTGCEDAASGLAPATAQEFTEAFCDTLPAPKAQGARP